MNHPRNLGRSWLHAIAPTMSAPVARSSFEAPTWRRPNAPVLALVPTTEELRRQLGLRLHQLSREESTAWLDEDEERRGEMRRAIREAIRELGGGELVDHRGRHLEHIE
jgi:hypothetical protein